MGSQWVVCCACRHKPLRVLFQLGNKLYSIIEFLFNVIEYKKRKNAA